VTRWADTFAALSRGADTLNTMRHSAVGTPAVSKSVNCVAASPQPPAPLDRPLARWSDSEKERAAIVEYDGDIPRAWSEGFARLDRDRPSADVPRHRWRRFVDDVGRFLDDQWADKAAALGWGPLDLFGCDRDGPFARIDQAGLLWLLSGDRLLALTENTATIATKTGERQTYRRKPSEPGRVLAWELADGERR
jgi:hypothetical protein